MNLTGISFFSTNSLQEILVCSLKVKTVGKDLPEDQISYRSLGKSIFVDSGGPLFATAIKSGKEKAVAQRNPERKKIPVNRLTNGEEDTDRSFEEQVQDSKDNCLSSDKLSPILRRSIRKRQHQE
jgi:hypothetical protein